MEHYFFLWACKNCFEQYSMAEIEKCRFCGCKEFADLTDSDVAVSMNVKAAKERLKWLNPEQRTI